MCVNITPDQIELAKLLTCSKLVAWVDLIKGAEMTDKHVVNVSLDKKETECLEALFNYLCHDECDLIIPQLDGGRVVVVPTFCKTMLDKIKGAIGGSGLCPVHFEPFIPERLICIKCI